MKQKEKNGFSLLETMVAFSVLTIAFIALTQAFPFGLSINKSAETATVAAYLAQEKLEEIISSGYEAAAVGTSEAKHRLGTETADYLYYYQRETKTAFVDANLNEIANDIGLKKITATVFFQDSTSRQEKEYKLSALITNY